MVLTYSTMLPLGTKAPDFTLSDVVNNEPVSLAKFADKKGLLVMFICKHCPYVVHIKDELIKIGQDYSNRDLGIVGISSTDAESYPADAPESLKEFALSSALAFPLLFDADLSVAKAYTAACTPDFFVFDQERKLVYRGQLDDSRPGNNLPLSGKDLRAALDAVLHGSAVNPEQKPSVGCNIKWKAGNEPSYFG